MKKLILLLLLLCFTFVCVSVSTAHQCVAEVEAAEVAKPEAADTDDDCVDKPEADEEPEEDTE